MGTTEGDSEGEDEGVLEGDWDGSMLGLKEGEIEGDQLGPFTMRTRKNSNSKPSAESGDFMASA